MKIKKKLTANIPEKLKTSQIISTNQNKPEQNKSQYNLLRNSE